MTALARVVSEIKPSEAAASIQSIEIYTQRISKKTEFLFVRMRMSNGAEGWGEATYNNLNGQVLIALRQLHEAIIGQSVVKGLTTLGRHPNWKHGRASAIAANALQCALLDILGQMREMPLHTLLGQSIRSDVPCYANINRGTKSRDPEGWANRALAATAAGFPAVKLAPFDKMALGLDGRSEGDLLPGLAFTRAVREAIGSETGLLVDCHWRFDIEHARDAIRALSDVGLFWIEAPILEDALSLPDLVSLKELAEETGTMLAGGEFFLGARAFRPFLHAHAYNVVNPDPRFCGILEMYDIAIEAAHYGVQIAPHNHLGPIMTAASLHIAALAPSALTLEMQFAEGDEPSCLEDPEQLAPHDGRIHVPNGPGLGISMALPTLTHVA